MSHSSQTASDPCPIAPCAVCGATFKVIVSSGKLRRHGHGNGQPPCPGSLQLPRVATAGATNSSHAAPSMLAPGQPQGSGPQTTDPRDFVFLHPERPVLLRIPKGTRQRAATEIENRLTSVVNAPDDISKWSNLLNFASTLTRPVRRGGGRNLITQVIK